MLDNVTVWDGTQNRCVYITECKKKTDEYDTMLCGFEVEMTRNTEYKPRKMRQNENKMNV